MKLTYEQMRRLSDIDEGGRLTIKDKKGHVLKRFTDMAPKPDGSTKITVFPNAAPTVPCPYGEPFPDLPSNWLLAAPSGQGKSQILLNLALKFYKGMFARIWIFCPSIRLDPRKDDGSEEGASYV